MLPYRKILSLKRLISELKISSVSSVLRDWGVVFFYILFIYLTLPFMPGLWRRFVQKVGNFAEYSAAIILLGLGLFASFYLFFRRKDIYSFLGLLMIGIAYAFGLSRLKLSIEKIHFVEYGFLSLFVFRALRHNIRDKSVYFWSAIIVFFLGWLDEGIQYVLPNRVYELRDVFVNGVAGTLGLSVIGLCFRPKLESQNEGNR